MSNPPDFEDFAIRAMREGWLVILLKPGGEELICRHIEHCTDADLQNRLTEDEVRIWLQRHP